MNKKITALTVTALASFALLGCNSDSDNDTESSNVNTGDTLILTANGMISSVDRSMPDKLVSNRKINVWR